MRNLQNHGQALDINTFTKKPFNIYKKNWNVPYFEQSNLNSSSITNIYKKYLECTLEFNISMNLLN